MIQKSIFSVPEAESLPVAMHDSDARGRNLLKLGLFAADLIRFPPGGKVDLHVHPGNHMLFCVDGHGRVQYRDEFHKLTPGVCYLIEGSTPRAVFADPDSQLTLIAIADDHRDVSSEDRLELCDGDPIDLLDRDLKTDALPVSSQ